ncbi:GNAT family N-acetyltransferase [Chloroflexota bacterium]
MWWNHYPGIISGEQIEYMLSRGYNDDTITRELKSGIVRWVTLLRDNKLIGFASYGPIDNTEEMQLYKLYIHPCFQREGYGTAFLQYLQKEASENGYKYLILTVNKKNVKAISAYSKNGFVIREPKITDIGNGFCMDDYIMSRYLVR